MALSVDDKIKMAIQECRGIWCYDIDNKFKYLYPFTTENLAAYFNKFDLKDKSIMTVGSSGDQALNAILYDCKDISVIDLCPFAKEYFYLKKAAIEVFKRKDYLKFFCYWNSNVKNNDNAFCRYDYNRLREVLSVYNEEVAYFWNTLYNHYKGLRLRKRLFNVDETEAKYLPLFNEYLASDTVYEELKNKIRNIDVNFEVANLFKTEIDKKYDFINLSNIVDSCQLEEFGKLISKMINALNDDGILLIAYMYLININDYTSESKLLIERLRDVLPNEIESFAFDSVDSVKRGISSQDSIITYKKVKKIG